PIRKKTPCPILSASCCGKGGKPQSSWPAHTSAEIWVPHPSSTWVGSTPQVAKGSKGGGLKSSVRSGDFLHPGRHFEVRRIDVCRAEIGRGDLGLHQNRGHTALGSGWLGPVGTGILVLVLLLVPEPKRQAVHEGLFRQ